MDIGALNRRITIQQQSTSQDSFGQLLTAWSDYYSCWASIAPIRGQQLYTSQFISKATTQITIRFTSSYVIKPNMRVVYTEKKTGVEHIFEVEAITNPEQANISIGILCYELDGAE